MPYSVRGPAAPFSWSIFFSFVQPREATKPIGLSNRVLRLIDQLLVLYPQKLYVHERSSAVLAVFRNGTIEMVQQGDVPPERSRVDISDKKNISRREMAFRVCAVALVVLAIAAKIPVISGVLLASIIVAIARKYLVLQNPIHVWKAVGVIVLQDLVDMDPYEIADLAYQAIKNNDRSSLTALAQHPKAFWLTVAVCRMWENRDRPDRADYGDNEKMFFEVFRDHIFSSEASVVDLEVLGPVRNRIIEEAERAAASPRRVLKEAVAAGVAAVLRSFVGTKTPQGGDPLAFS